MRGKEKKEYIEKDKSRVDKKKEKFGSFLSDSRNVSISLIEGLLEQRRRKRVNSIYKCVCVRVCMDEQGG